MTLAFKGAAKRIDDTDLPKLGAQIGVGEDELHAFLEAETRGSGFDPQGRPKILFERHKFYKYLPKEKRAAAVKLGLASTKPGGYGKESEQYGKLARAIEIDRKAALLSCSWGLAQIMGFNHKLAGYATVEAMVEAFMADEEAQLQAAVNFIKATGLDDELRAHNWAAFAKGYNGSDYRINRYDEKLAAAYAKWKKIRDTAWTPEAAVTPVQPEPIPNPTLPDIAVDAGATKDTDVVLVEGPKKDETQVVIVTTPKPNPATPVAPPSKTGLMAIFAVLGTIIAAAIKYFGG